MGKFLRAAAQILLSTLVLLLLLEVLCRAAGLATGANSYVESIILRNGLTPRKPAGEFRIFTYGESTMHGSHYAPASNPARWLEAYLKDFLPNKNIRVVNFSRMGQGSDFIERSFLNTSQYKPDLVVFYLGHNFFLPGNRVDQVRERERKFSFQFKLWIRQSALISSAIRLGLQRKLERRKDSGEDIVGAQEIETGPSGLGPENYVTRDTPYYKETLAHHLKNVDLILSHAAAKKIPVLLYKPAGNLKDFTPGCSVHRRPLSAKQEAAWKQNYEEGLQAQKGGDTAAALRAYQRAYGVDPTYADLVYRLAQVHLKSGQLEKARQLFEEAKNEDCLIVRAPQDVQEAIAAEGKKGRATVLDTEKLLISAAPGGILGDPIVEDNVHFSIQGHAILGRAAAQTIAVRGWIAPKTEWRFDTEKPIDEMARSLGVTEDLIFSAFLKCSSYFGSRYDSRILYAKKALSIYPEDPLGLRQLAWSYWLQGDQPKALGVYEKLAHVSPDQLEKVFQNRPEVRKAFTEKQPVLPAAVR
jgi:tetratricopeptide (TPR) repeat protein